MSTKASHRKQRRCREYSVGYARPPREHRFRPGVSGNPKGRPKGSENTWARLRRQLQDKVKAGPRSRMRAYADLIGDALVTAAMQGNIHAFRLIAALDEGELPGLYLVADDAGGDA